MCIYDDAHKPIAAVANERCIAIPIYPEISPEYDKASQAERANILEVFLQQEIKYGSEAKLGRLCSQVIEAWLAL